MLYSICAQSAGNARRLSDGALIDLLSTSKLPTLLTRGGDADIIDGSYWEGPQDSQLPPNVRTVTFGGGVPFLDQPEPFVQAVLAHFDMADGVTTPRELKF